MPTDSESLRTKYRVMTNLWLLAQLLQPGRQLYTDLTKDTFNDFLEELLSTVNFLYEKANRRRDAAPIWAHCMEYAFQLRREAMKLCREQGYSIQAALWAAHRNQEHRLKHWITLFSIAKTRSDTTSGKASREVGQLKKTSCPAPEGRIQVPTGGQRVRKKFSKLSSSTRFYSAAFEQEEKEDESKVTKMINVAPAKERVNILVHLLNSSTKLGTRFSTSTTRRDLVSVSLSKADLVRNRIAGSTTTVQAAIKWEYRATIAYAWLTSEKGPQLALVWSRSLPTWWRIVENLASILLVSHSQSSLWC